MWVEFVAGSLLYSERFFSRYSGFPLSSKTNISRFQFDQESGERRTTLWMCYLQTIIYLLFLFIYSLFIFQGHTKITLTGNVLYFIPLVAPGNYLYLEASYPRLPGDVARLRYHNTGSYFGCMEFIYHMSGEDIGWLKVYHVTDGGLETLLWGVTGDQGDVWKLVLIDLLDSDNGLPSQVRI